MIEARKNILGIRPGSSIAPCYVVIAVNEDEGVMATMYDSDCDWRRALEDHSEDRQVAATYLATKHHLRVELAYHRFALEQRRDQIRKEIKGAMESVQYGIFAVAPGGTSPNNMHLGDRSIFVSDVALRQLVDVAHWRDEAERIEIRIARADKDYFKSL